MGSAHKDIITTGLHVACHTVADAAARATLEAGLVSADRGKLVLQLDDGSLWLCTAAATLTAVGGDFPAGELGYAQITSNFESKSLTPVDVTGLEVTVTVGSRPIKVTGYSAMVDSHSAVGGRVFLWLYDVTADAVIGRGTAVNVSGNGQSVCMVARINPAAGSRTFKVQMSDDGSGTNCRIAAAATYPAFIMVEEI